MEIDVDDRGSFTELVHTENCGKVSINISKRVTMMTCNEIFDLGRSDTFFEKV